MSTQIKVSLCFTDLMEQANKGHSAFTRGKNGKVYVNIVEWVNDEPDKYGNDVSFQLNSTKEKRESEGKIYVGNGKRIQPGQSTAPAQGKVNDESDVLPF